VEVWGEGRNCLCRNLDIVSGMGYYKAMRRTVEDRSRERRTYGNYNKEFRKDEKG